MNSTWNKNIELLKSRFPLLHSLLQNDIKQIEIKGCNITDSLNEDETLLALSNIFNFWKFVSSKSSLPTVLENSVFLHSSYSPQKEAESLIFSLNNDEITTLFFCSFALGYAPLAASKRFPNKTIILIEPDTKYFLASLSVLDWEDFFKIPNCVIITGCEPSNVIQFLDKAGSKNHYKFIAQKNQTQHASSWFNTLSTLVTRNQNKNEINDATLEKFSSLWLKNSCKNISKFAKLDGINIYENKNIENLPCVVLAAGASLEKILPHLKEIKKRAIIICVDTALRACLRFGVEPDFIILIDPQFYAAQHILGLASPSSVLITESAAYPSVYRFPCRKIVLVSSLFPLGKYFEKHLGKKGELSTGGSVATVAWDFANYIGSKNIYMAGLDLGFSKKQTHFKGSTFEEKSHTESKKINTAETQGTRILFSANTENAKNYDGEQIITDSKMKLFAWWFESKIAGQKTQCKTFTFSTKGLFIPGIAPYPITDFLNQKEILKEKSEFFLNSEKIDSSKSENTKKFTECLENLLLSFGDLYNLAQKGFSLSKKVLYHPEKYTEIKAQEKVFAELNKIDKDIFESDAKDSASLVFPSEKKLECLIQKKGKSDNPFIANILRSSIIYSELSLSIKKYQKLLHI